MRQRQARWRAHGANLWQSKAHSRAQSRWHAPVGDALPRAVAFRVAACSGHGATAPKAGVVSASGVWSGCRWGQAYRLELQGLAAEDAYQALAGYVVQADAQELVLVGLPGF